MAFDFPASPTEGQMFAPVGGPLYVYNAPVWKVAGITTIPGEWVINEILITTTQAYVKPANLAYLEVEIQAPGGGGGPAIATAASQVSAGGGGGAGGRSLKLFDAVDVPASSTVTIGSGGASGATGGATSFGALMAAGGGIGGSSSVVTSISSTGAGLGGGGGVGSGGDINTQGQHGFWALVNTSAQIGTSFRGSGGSSPYGAGAQGIVAVGSSAGNNAGGYGSGGSGAGNQAAAGTAQLGGTGSPGFVRLREYYPLWVLNAAYPPGTITERLIIASETYIPPTGIKYLEIEGVGPGGGGGAAIGTAATQGSAGSGAGAGAYGKKLFKASDLPASVTITIGSPGTNSVNGGTSTFGALLSLGGGLKGNNSAAGPNVGTAGGYGGVASGFDINATGAPGMGAYIITPGTVPVTISGTGGASSFGGGGLGFSSAGATGAGFDALSYGGGGGGAANGASQAVSKAGGTGGTSFFKLREYY